MATTTATTSRSGRQAVTGRPARDRVAPPKAPAGRVRVPQLAAGLVLSGLAALGFVLWQTTAVQRMPVVALAADVVRGHTLTPEDLRVVYVASDDPLTVVSADDAAGLVGRVAVVGLPAGTLVVDGQFTAGAALVEGAGVVGVALPPGAYPTPRLAVGDLVNVLTTGPDDHEGGTVSRLLVEAAEVVGVDPVGTQGQVFVSLQTGELEAGEVATATVDRPIRLVLVARDRDGVGGGR